MLHLQNDAFSTVLAFHAPSELLNSLSVPHSCIPKSFSIVIDLSNGSHERPTDNDAISNFGPPPRAYPAALPLALLFLTVLAL